MSIHRCVPYRRSQPVWQPAQPAETTGLGDRAGRPAGPDRPEKQVAVARRNSRAADLAGRIGRRLAANLPSAGSSRKNRDRQV